jgi:hypothetical protein
MATVKRWLRVAWVLLCLAAVALAGGSGGDWQ